MVCEQNREGKLVPRYMIKGLRELCPIEAICHFYLDNVNKYNRYWPFSPEIVIKAYHDILRDNFIKELMYCFIAAYNPINWVFTMPKLLSYNLHIVVAARLKDLCMDFLVVLNVEAGLYPGRVGFNCKANLLLFI